MKDSYNYKNSIFVKQTKRPITWVFCLVFFFILFDCPATIAKKNSGLRAITKIGMHHKYVAFSTGKSDDFEHVFDLSKMLLDDEQADLLYFRDIKQSWKEYSLTFPIYDNKRSKLDLRHLGTVKHTVDWGHFIGEKHNVYGFLRTGDWLSGGRNGTLSVYNTQAEKIASFIGHSGTITAFAYHRKWLISGDSNGLMILWDLNEIKNRNPRIKPYLYMVYSITGDWVIWCEEGIYSCSKRGKDLMQISESKNRKSALAKESSDYHEKPDLLAMKITSFNRFQRQYDIEINNKKSIFSTPSVSFLNVPRYSPERDIDLLMTICDCGGGVDSAVLYLRDASIDLDVGKRSIAVKEKSPKETCIKLNQKISLLEGKNDITLIAYNDYGIKSKPEKVTVEYNRTDYKSSKLHIATIAVSDYANKGLKLQYPVADAKAIQAAFNHLGYGSFKSVRNHQLYNENVTKEQINVFFDQISTDVGAQDVFVLFIAGHGWYSAELSQYYFLLYNANTDNIVENSLGADEFRVLLSKIPAVRSLVLVDTCQSGGFESASDTSKIVTGAQMEFVNKLGRAILMASTKEQVAYEGYKNHGAFTYIVVDALKGKADYSKDGSITVDELSTYVNTNLADLTEKKWGYHQDTKRSLSGYNFILGKY